MDEKTQVGALALIKTFFGLSLQDIKAEATRLTALDIQQLGSAIARSMGKNQGELKFSLIEY